LLCVFFHLEYVLFDTFHLLFGRISGTIDYLYEYIIELGSFVLLVPLHLLHEALPLIGVVSSGAGPSLSPNDDESGEPISLGEYPFWHEIFALLNHLKFCIVDELYLLVHTVFIALTDNGNDEIHEHDVPDNQDKEPEEPSENFEVFGALND